METEALEVRSRCRAARSQMCSTMRRLSPHTSAAYRLDLASLVTFCEQEGLEDWDELAMEEQPLPGAVPMIVASRG